MNCVEESIKEKWEPILRGEHEPQGAYDCACCRQYLLKGVDGSCDGCPIATYTGDTGCKKTPEYIFTQLYYRWVSVNYDNHAELTAAAQWEIDFLNEVSASLKEAS